MKSNNEQPQRSRLLIVIIILIVIVSAHKLGVVNPGPTRASAGGNDVGLVEL
jgi:hypothetical protein